MLIRVVHQHATIYYPINYQCYWFAITIWSALTVEMYVPETKLEESWEHCGKVLKFIPVGEDSLPKIEAEHCEAMA
jgi:hypothetical protein